MFSKKNVIKNTQHIYYIYATMKFENLLHRCCWPHAVSHTVHSLLLVHGLCFEMFFIPIFIPFDAIV